MVSSSISFLYLQTNFCFLFLANQIFISEPIFLRRNNFRFRFLWKKSSKICLKSELKFFPPPLKKNLREVVFFVVHKLTFVLTIGIVTKIILKLSWLRKKNCFVTEKEENDYYSPMERKQRFFTSRWQAKHLWNQPSSKLKKSN